MSYYRKREDTPINRKISEIESVLTRSGYVTGGEVDKGTYYVCLRLDSPHRWLRIVKVLSAEHVEVSASFDDNKHPNHLTVTTHVAKLLDVAENNDYLIDNEVPF